MEVTRVFDILDNLKVNSSKTDILSSKENKKWVSHSVADFVSNVNEYLCITEFHRDMINVDFEMHYFMLDVICGTGEINGLILNSDGNKIVGLDNCNLTPKKIEKQNDSKG